MSKKYDVVQAKEIPGQEKPKWINVGIAFQDEGKMPRIKLDALPIPNEKGEIWLNLFEQKSRDKDNKPRDNEPI